MGRTSDGIVFIFVTHLQVINSLADNRHFQKDKTNPGRSPKSSLCGLISETRSSRASVGVQRQGFVSASRLKLDRSPSYQRMFGQKNTAVLFEWEIDCR